MANCCNFIKSINNIILICEECGTVHLMYNNITLGSIDSKGYFKSTNECDCNISKVELENNLLFFYIRLSNKIIESWIEFDKMTKFNIDTTTKLGNKRHVTII